MSIKEIIMRKFKVGLLFFVLFFLFILLSSLLIRIELLFSFYVGLFSVPLLLFYAPLWSTLSEILINRINIGKKKDTLTFLHMIGGFILPYILIALFNPEEFVAFLGSYSSSLPFAILGVTFSIFYLLLDRWYLERIPENKEQLSAR